MDKLQALMDAVKEMHDLFPMSAMRLVEAASDLQFALASGEVVVTTATEIDGLKKRIVTAEGGTERLKQLIVSVCGESPCVSDHHGMCQTHINTEIINGRCDIGLLVNQTRTNCPRLPHA